MESADAKDFWVNMPNLMNHLKKVAEQKPQATYYNVDMIKYQVYIHLLSAHLSAVCLHLCLTVSCFCASGFSRRHPVHTSESGRELAR